MKKRQGIGISKILWLLMIMTISIFLVQVHQVHAQCLTEGAMDSDCDGLTDTQETPSTQISQCGAIQTDPAIACNPTTKDLFVILVPRTGGLLPANPLSMLSTAGKNNLSITVHQILPTQTSSGSVRNVTSKQKAVRMLESNLSGSYVGYSSPGTPNTTADDAYVYTTKITSTIDTICGTKSCVDADNVTTTKQGVKDKYIRHTIAHETGHMMTLRGGCTTDAGCHYPSQTNVILDASVGYVNSGGGKKFSIGSSFTAPEDKDNVKLR